jgi:type IV secretion system protein TrbE
MNEAIAIGNATLGIVLFLVLFLRIRNVGAELNLKRHRSKEEGVSDLLNYAAMVEDGIIVGKNGSFMAAWLYKGDDNASSTDEHRNMVSFRINQALSGKGNGWMIHVDAVRRTAPNYIEAGLSHFPDPITAAIDEERRRHFEGLGTMYEGYFVLTVTYFPPMLAQSKFVELMFDDDEKGLTNQARTQGLLDTFKRDCLSLESSMSTAVKLERLKSNLIYNEDGTTVNQDEFLRWLQFCVTGINQPIILPSNPVFLDALICGQEMHSGSIPIIGRKHIQVVAIEGFPLNSTPGILAALAEQPCEYRWSSRFIFMDAHEAVSHLDKYRKKWRQKVRGFFDQVFNLNTGAIDQDAATMVADAETAISEINSGLVTQGYYTSVVVLMDESRSKLEASAMLLHKAITRLGFAARIETVNTTDAFMGSLPGHGTENVRRPLLHTMNLADLIPTSTIWAGENKAPCPFYPPLSPPLMNCVTHGDTPFRLNLHVDDVGHTLIFGPIGAGKSTLLGTLAAQFRRYQGMSIYVFDKGMSMYALTAAIRATTHGKSGKHFTVASDDGQLAFCPLQFLQTKGDRAWAMTWIETILTLNSVEITPTQRNEIGNAIMSMHESGAKTLSEFSLTIQDADIRAAIKQYTVDGDMGHLLDAEEDGLSLTDFTVFEIEELMNLGEKYALPTLLYLFRRIERSLKGQPAAIILDEAWLMLGHPAFREKIREWLKVLRKANCIVIMATQSLSDAANSGILDVMVESTGTKIFLPNIYARDEETSALYKRMNQNPRQIEILATAIPKRQYYYTSDKGRRLFDLALGPLSLAFVGVSDKDSVAAIKTLETKFGDKWIDEWLANRGLKLSDYMRNAA